MMIDTILYDEAGCKCFALVVIKDSRRFKYDAKAFIGYREYLADTLNSRSLKSTFLRDIVTKQHSAEFFNKSPKNPHGSFEVICSRSQQYIDYISEDTFIKVASQATF